jgi:hypothetical protein
MSAHRCPGPVEPGPGVASRVRGVSESLAGRVGFVALGGFDLTEVAALSAWSSRRMP